MSDFHTCTVHEFPIPEREYRAAPSAMWDKPAAPSRLKRRRKRSGFLPFILAGLILFELGFLLGRAEAAESAAGALNVLPEEERGLFTLLPEEPEDAASVRTVPGAVVVSTGKEEDWRLVLVNAENPLPEGFTVPELTQLRSGHAVDSRAYPELQRMMDDCRAAGLAPVICSSYRSWDKQSELFEKKVRTYSGLPRAEAEARAAEWVSRPGTSEHQAGLALDIVDKTYQLLDEGQEKTAVQKWLMAHCAEYGYILRYPTAKSALTGVGYEPWHYRYVGVEAAQEIMSQGICLEEYLL